MKKSTSERFSGLAQSYSKSRPSYPQSAIDYIFQTCQLKSGATVADIGCGTGISSRLFARDGIQVIGVEPNEDMLSQAKTSDTASGDSIEYRFGTAEETGLPDSCADLVVCAQAFHWFRSKESLSEFSRILKNGGYCALLWNERDHKQEATRAYGDVVVKYSTDPAVELKRGASGKDLILSELFKMLGVFEFTNSQTLDLDQLLGRAFSTSYMPHEGEELEKAQAEISQVFEQYAKDGLMTLSYVTTLYLAQKTDTN